MQDSNDTEAENDFHMLLSFDHPANAIAYAQSLPEERRTRLKRSVDEGARKNKRANVWLIVLMWVAVTVAVWLILGQK
jgi:CHASE3 domain sensor protein